MKKRRFTLWHSVAGTALLLAVEGILLRAWPDVQAGAALILICAAAGSMANIYVTTEVIEDVRAALHMLTFLSIIVGEFIIFFTFQYWYLLLVQPASFPTLMPDGTSLLLHSTMIFVFNPLYLPATGAGRALLLINTLASLGLVLFILQNIGALRRSAS